MYDETRKLEKCECRIKNSGFLSGRIKEIAVGDQVS